ncbi:MAG: dienelactone hydrolase family protein [Solirubrobacterales bacterium]|nr:dienelactone hydrolase family protein [Solirubrobacterales bacterium]
MSVRDPNTKPPRELSAEQLRGQLDELLAWHGPPRTPPMRIVDEQRCDAYVERLVEYPNLEREDVRAFLLLPDVPGPVPGVVVHHQHNRQRHLGKSEVNGSAGDPIQAFGPRLANAGFAVLAPDAICFEDRRRDAFGIDPHVNDERQHYDEMAYRLVGGSLLMTAVVADAAVALSVLAGLDEVASDAIGMLGHSMGGHTTLFAAAVDQRVRFACISGALCGYQARIDARVGIELAQVIPGILRICDFDGLLRLLAPRPVLIVSASEDPYSFDAPSAVARAREEYVRHGQPELLAHAHFSGSHPLTEERIDAILRWLTSSGEGSGRPP